MSSSTAVADIPSLKELSLDEEKRDFACNITGLIRNKGLPLIKQSTLYTCMHP